MTEPTQDLAARRRDIVRAVADLSEKHGLPMPMETLIYEGTVSLCMDENDPEGVARWAEATNNGPVTTSRPMGGGYRPFVAVKSDRHLSDRPTWMGVQRLDIWSACDVPEGSDRWSAMIPDPHPPKNCGPLDLPLPPGAACPTCGTVPEGGAE